MTKSFPPRLLSKLKLPGLKLLLWCGVVYLLLVISSLCLAGYQLDRLKQIVNQNQFDRLETQLVYLSRTLRLTDALTLHKVPDLRWSRQVIATALALNTSLTQLGQNFKNNQVINLTNLNQVMTDWAKTSDQFLRDFNQSWLVKLSLSAKDRSQIQGGIERFSLALPAINKILTGPSHILIVLQNRNELRASGGFMGSYLLISLNQGQVTDLKFEDIYDADGQFTGFVAAPAGVKEYLSSDHGLRLPDSNWSAEFSQAAPTILSYFSLGKKTDINLLIAVNQRPLSQLLALTGPVKLPDYQTELRPDNLDQLLQNRGEFFPGSRAKIQLLTTVFTQIKNHLASGQVSVSQLVTILAQSRIKKDILAFAPDPDLQKLLAELKLTGDITPVSQTDILYLIESNVGINKVNPWVERQVILTPESDQLKVQIEWSNSADQAYINYQRLLVPVGWAVTQVKVNHQPVTKLDQTPLELANGAQVNQLGFLATVPGQDQTQAEIDFKLPAGLERLNLIAQPGQKPYPVTLRTQTQTQNFTLDQDLVLSW